MATLPSLIVNDEMATRILAAFRTTPEAADDDAVIQFQTWLKDTVITYVVQRESSKRRTEFSANEIEQMNTATADLHNSITCE